MPLHAFTALSGFPALYRRRHISFNHAPGPWLFTVLTLRTLGRNISPIYEELVCLHWWDIGIAHLQWFRAIFYQSIWWTPFCILCVNVQELYGDCLILPMKLQWTQWRPWLIMEETDLLAPRQLSKCISIRWVGRLKLTVISPALITSDAMF